LSRIELTGLIDLSNLTHELVKQGLLRGTAVVLSDKVWLERLVIRQGFKVREEAL
jgi:hypothetical protein